MNAQKYANGLRDHLAPHADPEKAEPMRRYMRDQFAFFGIQTKPRRQLVREYIRENGLPEKSQLSSVAKQLWRLPERELHHAGQDLVEKRIRKLTPDDFPLIEHLVTEKSWWDTVDFIATKLAGPILLKNRDLLSPKSNEWLDSGNLWLQRTAILCQLKWKDQTDRERLGSIIEQTKESPEFFLRKAIGWALREYARTDPEWVSDFVEEAKLKGLSRREALKHIGNHA